VTDAGKSTKPCSKSKSPAEKTVYHEPEDVSPMGRSDVKKPILVMPRDKQQVQGKIHNESTAYESESSAYKSEDKAQGQQKQPKDRTILMIDKLVGESVDNVEQEKQPSRGHKDNPAQARDDWRRRPYKPKFGTTDKCETASTSSANQSHFDADSGQAKTVPKILARPKQQDGFAGRPKTFIRGRSPPRRS